MNRDIMMDIKIAALVLLGALCLTLPAQATPVRYGSMIHNLNATTDPGVTDDVSPGRYTVGSMWVDTANESGSASSYTAQLDWFQVGSDPITGED